VRLLAAFIALVGSAYGAPNSSFVDADRTELIKAAPELGTLEFDSDQSGLDPLLRVTGQQLESMFAKFINVSIAEDVHEMRFDSAHMMWTEQREKFTYVGQAVPFAELRRKANVGLPALLEVQRFLVAGHFLEMLKDLLPANQKQSRFQYLGQIAESGGRSFVVAFAQRDETRQGLVWVDEVAKRVVRLRFDVLKPVEGQSFESFTRDVRFVPVTFSALETTPWLPSGATVHVRFAGGELHSVHRFSDYHVDGFENDSDPVQLKEDTGEAPGFAAIEEDSIETLLKGVAALEAQKPSEALAPLREAVTRLPDRAEPGYYMGLALLGTDDLAAAETQFRQAVKRSPTFAPAHNELGVVLFRRGDAKGAVAEFSEAVRLDPANPTWHTNLDKAAPKPVAATARAAVSPTAGDVTIKVDVLLAERLHCFGVGGRGQMG